MNQYFTQDDKDRVIAQVRALWELHMASEGAILKGIRFEEYNNITLIVSNLQDYDHYEYALCNALVSEDDSGTIQFTEEDWEDWCNSGLEPYPCDNDELHHIMIRDMIENSTWHTIMV